MLNSPTLRALNPDEDNAMQKALVRAARIAGSTSLGFPELQGLYDRLLAQSKRDDEDVIALGIAYGALINQLSGFEWVRVSDQHGEETCIRPPNKSIHCAPISMLQKRLTKGERVDLQQLANSTVGAIRSMVEEGKTGGR